MDAERVEPVEQEEGLVRQGEGPVEQGEEPSLISFHSDIVCSFLRPIRTNENRPRTERVATFIYVKIALKVSFRRMSRNFWQIPAKVCEERKLKMKIPFRDQER